MLGPRLELEAGAAGGALLELAKGVSFEEWYLKGGPSYGILSESLFDGGASSTRLEDFDERIRENIVR